MHMGGKPAERMPGAVRQDEPGGIRVSQAAQEFDVGYAFGALPAGSISAGVRAAVTPPAVAACGVEVCQRGGGRTSPCGPTGMT